MMDSAWISRAIGSVCIILISSLTSVKNLSVEAKMEEVCFKSDAVGLCSCTGPLPDLPPRPDFTPPDPCSENFCMNGGTCVPFNGTSFTCNCPPVYSGELCEKEQCKVNECLNGGTCVVVDMKDICMCAPGYTGPHCKTGSKGGVETWMIPTFSVCSVLCIAGIVCLVCCCRRKNDCDGKSKGKTTEAQTDGHNDTCADLEQGAASFNGGGQVDKVNDPGKGIDSPDHADDDKGKDHNVTSDGGDHVDEGDHLTPEKLGVKKIHDVEGTEGIKTTSL